MSEYGMTPREFGSALEEHLTPSDPGDGRCERMCRGYGRCGLDDNHKGRHSTEVFQCDGCLKMRRGKPAMFGPDGEHYCFMCAPPSFYNISRDLYYRSYAGRY